MWAPSDSRDDGQVAPAAFLPVVSIPFATAVPGQLPEFSFSIISQGSGAARTVWPIDGQTTVVRLSESGIVTVVGTSDPGNEVTVQTRNGPAVIVRPWTDAGDRFQSTFRIDPNQPRVTIRHAPTNRTIDVISPTDAVPQPRITQIFNNASATTTQFVPGDTPAVLEGYLRLAGEEVFDGTELSFPVFRGDNDAQHHGVFLGYARPVQPVSSRPGRTMAGCRGIAECSLPDSEQSIGIRASSGEICLQTRIDSLRQSPSQPKKSNPQEVPRAGDLKISRQKPEQDRHLLTRDEQGVYLTRQPEFWVHGTINRAKLTPPLPLTAKDLRVTVLLDGESAAGRRHGCRHRPSHRPVGETHQGPRRPTVRGFQGGRRGEFPAGSGIGSGHVLVRRTGPGILPLGSPTSLGEIKVTFDGPIKIPASGNFASANFQLKPDSGAAAPRRRAEHMPGASDQFVETVTVKFPNVQPALHVHDLGQRNQDRLGKMPETKDQALPVIGRERNTTTPGVTGSTGGYVSFPEYTEPRPIVDGFNPSDHVRRESHACISTGMLIG